MYSKQYNIKSIVLKTLENFGWHYMSDVNLRDLDFNPKTGIIQSVFRVVAAKLNSSEKDLLRYLSDINSNKSFLELLNNKKEISFLNKDLLENSFIVSDNFICDDGTVLEDFLVLFINGVPVSFILCDNDISIEKIQNAFKHVDENNQIAIFNLFNIVINENSLFYGCAKSDNSIYQEWIWKYSYGIIPTVIDNNPFYETNKYFNTIYNTELYQNIYGLLNVQHLNILIRDFIKFNDEGLKVLPSYQEFKDFDSCVTC